MNRKTVASILGIALVSVYAILASLSTGSVQAQMTAVDLVQTPLYPDQTEAVERAVLWLVTTHQNEDGGYTSFSTGANQAPSDVGGTVDAILAISSGGFAPAVPGPGQENSPVDYLRQNVESLQAYASADGGQAGKTVMALVSAGLDPRDFGGVDFVNELLNHLSFNGQFDVEDAFSQSLAILALSAAGEPVPEEAVTWLMDKQAGDEYDGSWDDGFGTSGNADATAMSVMALASTGLTATHDSLARAAGFLTRTQLADGGWEYGAGFGENANSTAMAVQALSALGLDFYNVSAAGASPLSALLSWQGESGAFQADFGEGPFDDFFSTIQALPAAAGRSYPLPGRMEAARRAASCLSTLQDPLTGGWEQFAGFGVNAAGTSRAIQAIAAVGDNPQSARWTVNEVSALQSLENLVSDFLATGRGGGVGIVLQGVVAAGADARNFAGRDLVLEMSGYLSPTGEYDDTSFGPFSHAEAMLGLLDAGADVDPTAVDWLLGAQTGGDWGSPDATGIALQVLGRLGLEAPEALDVLHATQEYDGGWGFGVANPSSSSEVVQGLAAVGENPFGPAWSRVVSGTLTSAAEAIMAQQGENGCWPNQFGPGDDPFGTTDAIMLLTQRPGWGVVEPADENEAVAPAPTETAEPSPTETAAPTETPPPVASPTLEEATAEATATPSEVAAAETPSPTEAAPAGDGGQLEETPAAGGFLPIVLLIGLLIVVAAIIIYRRFRV